MKNSVQFLNYVAYKIGTVGEKLFKNFLVCVTEIFRSLEGRF